MIRHRSALRTVVTFLTLAAAVLLVCGCTARQTEDEYSEHLERALTARNDAVDKLDANALPDQAAYKAAAKRLRDSVREVNGEPPPKQYQDAHDLLVDSLEDFAVLLGKLGRCKKFEIDAPQDARACNQSIGQEVFDELRNDMRESDAIYRQEGLALSQLSDDGTDDASSGGGGDVLDEPSGG